jgi:hypothetical protein
MFQLPVSLKSVLTDGLGTEMIGRSSKSLTLCQIEGEERTATPADNETCEFYNGKGEQLPRDPEVEKDTLQRVGVGLEEFPLPLSRRTLTKIWIPRSSLFTRQRCHVVDFGVIRCYWSLLNSVIFSRPGPGCFCVLDGSCVGFLAVRGWCGWRIVRYVMDFIRVWAVKLGLWEHEDDHEYGESKKTSIEPPEVSPVEMLGESSRDDRTQLGACQLLRPQPKKRETYHQRAHVHHPI